MIKSLIKSIPNFLTISRVLLIFLAFYSYYHFFYRAFLFLVMGALATDFFDGFLARALKVTSHLGSILDPACDKIITVLMVSFFYIEGVLTKLFCVCLMARPFVQIMSFLLVSFFGIKFSVRPSFLAKMLNTFIFCLIFLFSFLLSFHSGYFWESSNIIFFLLLFVSFAELLFMVYYPYQFFQILRRKKTGFY